MKLHKLTVLGLGSLAALSTSFAGSSSLGKNVVGGDVPPAPSSSGDASWTDIWDYATLYENENASFFQEFSLVGRYHGQLYHNNSSVGEASDYETRRFRVGFSTQLTEQLSLESQWNINKNLDGGGIDDNFFDSIEDFILEYDAGVGALALGKLKPRITREYDVSSKRIKTIERSLLTNQIISDKLWGGNWTGESGDIGYQLGAYFADADSAEKGFDNGWLSTSSDLFFTASVDIDDIRVNVTYLNDTEDAGGVAPYELTGSVSYSNYGKGVYEGIGLFAEAIYATGADDVDDAYGITLMPSVFIADNIELVARYHLAASDGDEGIRTQKRYDRASADVRGDLYHGLYGGMNVYLNSDKLKLMTGLEFSDLSGADEDFDAWTFMSGVRLYF